MRPMILVLVCVSLIFGAAAAGYGHDLLSRYEPGDLRFEEFRVGDKIVLFNQRMVDSAIVEKDYIVYQFDSRTEALLARKSHWREGLADHLPHGLIPRGQAEVLACGEVLHSRLYIISPESHVFSLDPVPENPCWVVRSRKDGHHMLTVVDAVTGRLLGNGIPPPYDAFGMSGPAILFPCSRSWSGWVIQAANYLEAMGYSVEQKTIVPRWQVRENIQSTEVAVFFEIAHGTSEGFISECVTRIYDETLEAAGQGLQTGMVNDHIYDPLRFWTSSEEVAAWIADYPKMPFAFLGNCGGMCDTGPGTLSHAFRKGSLDSTVTVGYCDMHEEFCSDCWLYAADWQDALFEYASQGWTVKDAFDQANVDYPACGINRCMRFEGDPLFTLVPVVRRDPSGPALESTRSSVGEEPRHGDVPDDVVLLVVGGPSGGYSRGAGKRIEYGLPVASSVRISVYDVTGRRVSELVNGQRSGGYHWLLWETRASDAGLLSPGVYFVRLDSAVGCASAKLILTN